MSLVAKGKVSIFFKFHEGSRGIEKKAEFRPLYSLHEVTLAKKSPS